MIAAQKSPVKLANPGPLVHHQEQKGAVEWRKQRPASVEAKTMGKKLGGGGDGSQKAFLWRLPEVTSKELGKIGPGFGLGIGCGAGAGIGFFGGTGLGYGFPGLTLGFGVGAGCGVGFGFGYGLGKGLAYDENKRYSNVGKMFQEAPHLPTDTFVALFDELVINTKKLATATSKGIEKWR